MTEGAQPTAGGGPFDAIDPKLTVFALANGMDLEKYEASRKLTWFTEGLERGLEIRSTGDTYSVLALAWKTKAPEEAKTASVSDAVALGELSATLEAGITEANAL